MDSMVNHYTAARRRRSDDAYTPEGKAALERAREIAAAGLDGFGSIVSVKISEAEKKFL